VGDCFAGQWVAGAFEDVGMTYETSRLNKSALYLEMLPALNRVAVSLPQSGVTDWDRRAAA